jgi:hypothetical protein
MSWRPLILLVFCVVYAAGQVPPSPNPNDPQVLRTPDGRNRTEMILKADHEQSLKDLDQIRKLVDDVKIEMEKNDRHVLSVGAIKKLDEIEKLTKRVRSRMKRF